MAISGVGGPNFETLAAPTRQGNVSETMTSSTAEYDVVPLRSNTNSETSKADTVNPDKGYWSKAKSVASKVWGFIRRHPVVVALIIGTILLAVFVSPLLLLELLAIGVYLKFYYAEDPSFRNFIEGTTEAPSVGISAAPARESREHLKHRRSSSSGFSDETSADAYLYSIDRRAPDEL